MTLCRLWFFIPHVMVVDDRECDKQRIGPATEYVLECLGGRQFLDKLDAAVLSARPKPRSKDD